MRRDKKKKLADNILVNMKKFQIDFMNTKNGKLVYCEFSLGLVTMKAKILAK